MELHGRSGSPVFFLFILSICFFSDIGGYIIGKLIGGKKLKNSDVKNAHIVIGTPGRVYDMIQRGMINMEKLTMFILDEADQMLNIGFKDQIIDIFELETFCR